MESPLAVYFNYQIQQNENSQPNHSNHQYENKAKKK